MATDLRDTALNPNMPMRRDQLAQMTATPRSPRLGFLADAMMALKEFGNRVQVPAGVPLLGGEGVGSLLLGKAPEELVEMSYGNMPMRINPYAGQTASFVPEMKVGRGAQVADLLSLAGVPGGGRTAAAAMGAADLGTGAERAIFIGSKSKTWDRDAAQKALDLEKAGASPESIWSETGTFRGADGKWRQEISDDAARLKEEGFSTTPVPRSKVMFHGPLTAAYPSSGRNVQVRITEGSGGAYTPLPAEQGLVDIGGAQNPDQARSTLLHELQHDIQQREGFATGGNPNLFQGTFIQTPEQRDAFNLYATLIEKYSGQAITPSDLQRFDSVNDFLDAYNRSIDFDQKLPKKDWDELNRTLEYYGFRPNESQEFGASGLAEQISDYLMKETEKSWISPEEQYMRLAGEAEARAVQARMNMKPEERRAVYPYQSYDVPVEQLIIRQD